MPPAFGTVSSLLNSSILTLAYHIQPHLSDIKNLPPNLKSKLLYILTKRGLVTDENIANTLHGRLKEIDLSECNISDTGLKSISQVCNQLTKIDLNSAKESRETVTSCGIKCIAQGCRSLEVIYLRRCLKMDDEAVIVISRNCRRLRHLNLGGCSMITDKSLLELAENCPFLESLNVSSSKVSDDGIHALCQGECKNTLKEIHVASCRSVSDSAVEAIMEFCPRIQILLFHGCPLITESSRVALEELLARNSVKMKQITWTIY